MLRRFGSFVFAVLVGSAVLAQTRQPLVGTVVDSDGKPVAGAAVTLVEDDVDLVCRVRTSTDTPAGTG